MILFYRFLIICSYWSGPIITVGNPGVAELLWMQHCVLCDSDPAAPALLQNRASCVHALSLKHFLFEGCLAVDRYRRSCSSPVSAFRIFPLTHIVRKESSAQMPTFTLTTVNNFVICAVIILICTSEKEGMGKRMVCPLIKWDGWTRPSTFKGDLILEGLKCFWWKLH